LVYMYGYELTFHTNRFLLNAHRTKPSTDYYCKVEISKQVKEIMKRKETIYWNY
jgi:hypothetical protein